MYISYLAIPFMLVSSVPQIIKIIKTKNVEGVSISMFYLTFIAVFLLLIEAINVESIILIISDSCSLLMLGINIVLIKKYKKSTKNNYDKNGRK